MVCRAVGFGVRSVLVVAIESCVSDRPNMFPYPNKLSALDFGLGVHCVFPDDTWAAIR